MFYWPSKVIICKRFLSTFSFLWRIVVKYFWCFNNPKNLGFVGAMSFYNPKYLDCIGVLSCFKICSHLLRLFRQ